MNYDGVIFDKDGVLLNSMNDNFLWADKLRIEEAERRNIDLSLDQAKRIVKLNSLNDLKKLEEDLGVTQSFIRETEMKIAKKKIQKMRSGQITPFNSAEKVLNSIDAPKSVASNAPMIATEFTVEHFEIKNYFEEVLAPELSDIENYVKYKKPSKAMLLDAISAMEVENPVMVGDSEDDILAAKNAGIDSIHVKTNGGVDVKPDHQVQSLEYLLEILN